MDRVMPRKLRGFTLTEAAIVLGIVGLILGAIWVAAAAVYNNLRVSTASGQLLQIAQSIRSIHATQQTIPGLVGHAGAVTMAEAGGIPRDMIDDPANPAAIRNVWNGEVWIDSAPIGAVADTAFTVTFNDIPRTACVDLLVRTTGSNRDSGLYVAGTTVDDSGSALAVTNGDSANAFPITVNDAVAYCNDANDMNDVSFTFTLRT